MGRSLRGDRVDRGKERTLTGGSLVGGADWTDTEHGGESTFSHTLAGGVHRKATLRLGETYGYISRFQMFHILSLASSPLFMSSSLISE